MKDRFAKDYVVVMIDQDRMTDGAALAKELNKDRGRGIPWSVILSGDGEELVTSDGPRGNCGCPAQPHEIDHFLTMVDATRDHMSEDDRVILERELRSYGAELLRPRRESPGYAAFDAARNNVRTGRFGEALAELRTAAEQGFAVEEVLSDPRLRPLREDPDSRASLSELIGEHVEASHVRMVDPYEPGKRIRLEGRIVDAATGKPIAGAWMHLLHTDASGEYRPGMTAGGGAGNPRLFGYLRSDAEGRFTVDTILPERYPDSTVPRHVHYTVRAEGYGELESQCYFDSDPNLGDSSREWARDNDVPVIVLEKDEELRRIGELTVKLPKR